MESFLSFIQEHVNYAHWILFVATLLAGMNIPISIDLLMITGAILASTLIPQHLFQLYFSLFFGCIFSAWIAYAIGRYFGPRLIEISFFSKLLPLARRNRIEKFYREKGALALFIGRFIPFGVRNCLYMTSGMSRMSFLKFMLWDGLACSLWSSFSFFLYYSLGKNIDMLYAQVRKVNLLIFLAFSVTVIGIIWYKKKKKVKDENV